MDSALVTMLGVVTIASQVFGPWERVAPSQINKPVPLFSYAGSIPGAVRKEIKGEKYGCPIVEHGKTVGWSLSCNQ